LKWRNLAISPLTPDSILLVVTMADIVIHIS
jgi:hypothetical protein